MTDQTQDPFPAWLAEWEAALAAYDASGQDEELDRPVEALDRPVEALEKKITKAPTRTIAGVVAKLRIMIHLSVVGFEPPKKLYRTALDGAEHVMAERLGGAS